MHQRGVVHVASSVIWDLNGGSNGGGCAPQNYVTDTNQSYLQSEPMADWPGWTYCNDTSSGDLEYYFIQVEVSSPTATVAPVRAPDSNGWYNHPVAGAVSASSFSGIASCTSTTYAGPATTGATVAGTCTDNAGKSVTVASAPFAYDATPPTLTATADPGDQSVALSWQAGETSLRLRRSRSLGAGARTLPASPPSTRATEPDSRTPTSRTASTTRTRSPRATRRGTWR